MFLGTPVAEEVENWFWGSWEFVVFMAVLVVKVVPCKAKKGFGAVVGGLTLVVFVGVQVAAVVETGEVAGKCLYEGLFRRDGGVVVDQKK